MSLNILKIKRSQAVEEMRRGTEQLSVVRSLSEEEEMGGSKCSTRKKQAALGTVAHAGCSRLRQEDCKLGANRSYIVRTYKKQTKQMKQQDGGQLASSITHCCGSDHAIN